MALSSSKNVYHYHYLQQIYKQFEAVYDIDIDNHILYHISRKNNRPGTLNSEQWTCKIICYIYWAICFLGTTRTRSRWAQQEQVTKLMRNHITYCLFWYELGAEVAHVLTPSQSNFYSTHHCIWQCVFVVEFSQRCSNHRFQIAGDLQSHDLKLRWPRVESCGFKMLIYMYIYIYVYV